MDQKSFSSKSKFLMLLLGAALALAVLSGGCGGSSHHHKSSDSDTSDPNGPEDYRSEIAERLLEEDNVIHLRDFLNGTVTAKKGDVLLYYPASGEDLTAAQGYLDKMNKALNDGAVLAFVNITAEEIDKFADDLALDIPPYTTDDATDEERKTLQDFYAVAARINADYTESNDEEPVDFYEYMGLELFDDTTTSMEVYYYNESGDAVKFDPSTAKAGTGETKTVESGDAYDWEANPYSRADATVEDFKAWVDGLSGLKTITEDQAGTAAARIAANETTPTKKGVSMRFDFHSEPRQYYFTYVDAITLGLTDNVIHREHGAWHRETGMNFDITSFHDFSTGADYYAFKVTGQTNPSKQYAHPSEMDDVFGNLHTDIILGYNREFAYKANLCYRKRESGKGGGWSFVKTTPVGTVVQSAPVTLNNSVKKSNGFTFSLDGNIGVGYSTKDGLKGDASLKPSWKWESKEEYTVTDYECVNESGSQRASWRWKFQLPQNGSQGFSGVWLKDVPESGKSAVSLASEFLIKVEKREWTAYPELRLWVDFEVKEGATEGGRAFYGVGNAGRRDWTLDYILTDYDYVVKQPPHIAVEWTKSDFELLPAKGVEKTVQLLSEEDWTATPTESWITMTAAGASQSGSSLSGSATGAAKKAIVVSLAANTTGKARTAQIKFQSKKDALDFCTIDVLQAGK